MNLPKFEQTSIFIVACIFTQEYMYVHDTINSYQPAKEQDLFTGAATENAGDVIDGAKEK